MENLVVRMARIAAFGAVPGAMLSTYYFHGRPHLTWASGKTFAWSTGQGVLLAIAGIALGLMPLFYSLGPESDSKPTPNAWAKGAVVYLAAYACVGLAAKQFPHHLGRPMEAVAGMVLATAGGFIYAYCCQER